MRQGMAAGSPGPRPCLLTLTSLVLTTPGLGALQGPPEEDTAAGGAAEMLAAPWACPPPPPTLPCTLPVPLPPADPPDIRPSLSQRYTLLCVWWVGWGSVCQRRPQSTISTRAWFSKHTLPDCQALKDSNKFKWNSCLKTPGFQFIVAEACGKDSRETSLADLCQCSVFQQR